MKVVKLRSLTYREWLIREVARAKQSYKAAKKDALRTTEERLDCLEICLAAHRSIEKRSKK